MKIAILASGEGTTAEHVWLRSPHIGYAIEGVFTNNKNAGVTSRFTYITVVEKDDNETRVEYDIRLLKYLNESRADLILLLGWMHVFSKEFIENSRVPIINLHPALPGQFPGVNAIDRAWQSYQQGKITETGVMTHYIVPEIDAGEVIVQKVVNISGFYDYDDYYCTMRETEKDVIISTLQKMKKYLKYNRRGKVRNIYEFPGKYVVMKHSDRLSSFDKYVCDVPNKGVYLCETSSKWFKFLQKYGAKTHYIFNDGDMMLVRKCEPIPLEIVVRGYITGSSKTSLWTLYQEGKEGVYGFELPRGIEKDSKLDNPVITPTTKGEVDEPTSPDKILESGVCTKEELDVIYKTAMNVFKLGQTILSKKGYTLVDTKYEFGRDVDTGEILLIDEVHTQDSSRIWREGETVSRDKDIVRKYVKENPGKEVTNEVKEQLVEVYREYLKALDGEFPTFKCKIPVKLYENYIRTCGEKLVVILAGSEKDAGHIEKIKKALWKFDVSCLVYYASAHKQLDKLTKILKYFKDRKGLVFITVAGLSNALSGVVAGNTESVVIACPPLKDNTDISLNVYSSLMMPSNVPVMTVLNPANAAMCAYRILKN